ncbi:MAG: FtsQ-type POTRA domain-containing protein [Limnohabitans sp.]|nr:MAG: FtsQ-type POTRA domain-containing protein [Limnohabitans sp.]
MNKVASLMLTLFVLVCLASGLWWVLRHPSFALQLITVEGEVSRNNALTLKTNVVPQLNGNFFTLELERARQAFEAVPWVRSAVVHREFPNRLRVRLQEQHPVALWGEEGSSTLVNEQGQVFEANLGEVEADALPRLKGPVSQSQQVLAMYQTLRPVLQGADMDMDELELSPRGSWKVVTSQGVTIELGRGQPQALTALLQDFLRTLPQITSRYGRTPKSLAAADLRHKDGYALRLQGVTTTEGDPRKKP